MAEEITIENLKTLDLGRIALNPDLGILNFKTIHPLLEKLRKILVEFEELDYRAYLTASEQTEIRSVQLDFIGRLKRMQTFSISGHNAAPQHSSIQAEINTYCQESITRLRTNLIFLRQEVALKSSDAKELQYQQQLTAETMKHYQEMLKELKTELDSLRKEKGDIEKAHGEIAATVLAQHFRSQVDDHKTKAARWLMLRNIFYYTLLIIIVINLALYLAIKNEFWIKTNIFTFEYALLKLALLSVLSYGIVFASKNYNVYSNLVSVNMHRQTVAQTIDDFLATNPDGETKSQILKQGTEAMFKHIPIGHIGKIETVADRGPIHELITVFTSKKD